MKLLEKSSKIVSMCPHCVVNLEKEYKKYGDISYKVEHHSQLIGRLIEQGKIAVNIGNNGKVTYHDPCNLSRILDIVDAPRTAIESVTNDFFELPESGKNTLCCGAGGGLWWKKETVGKTHLVRSEQVVKSKANTVVTGCNFCYGMMNQGLDPLIPEGKEKIQVKDLSDIIAENIV